MSDLEHIGGSGLLLQRLAQLIEQAGVLDRDNRLGGEVFDQLPATDVSGIAAASINPSALLFFRAPVGQPDLVFDTSI